MTEVFHRARLNARYHKGNRLYTTPEGDEFPSVTSVLGVENKKTLNTWKLKRALAWAKENPEVISAMPQAALDKIADDIPNYGNNAAASGEIVHKIWEDLALGREPFIPAGFEEVPEHWKRFNEDFEVETIAVEPEVYNNTFQYAGSLDALYKIRARGWWTPETDDTSGVDWNEWQTVVLDVKSGNGLYGSTAIQCCAYAKAEKLIHPHEGVIDMPEVTATAGLWVRKSGYAFYPLAFDDRVWRHFVAARRLWMIHGNDWGLRGRPINPNALKSPGAPWEMPPQEV